MRYLLLTLSLLTSSVNAIEVDVNTSDYILFGCNKFAENTNETPISQPATIQLYFSIYKDSSFTKMGAPVPAGINDKCQIKYVFNKALLGDFYFAIKHIDSKGVESSLSNVMPVRMFRGRGYIKTDPKAPTKFNCI